MLGIYNSCLFFNCIFFLNSFGYIPNTDLMQFLALATSGAYLCKAPPVRMTRKKVRQSLWCDIFTCLYAQSTPLWWKIFFEGWGTYREGGKYCQKRWVLFGILILSICPFVHFIFFFNFPGEVCKVIATLLQQIYLFNSLFLKSTIFVNLIFRNFISFTFRSAAFEFLS